MQTLKCAQWILSNMDTVGTKIFVLISEVFQGENSICIYIKLGLSQVFCRYPYLRGVPVFHYRGSHGEREERWYCNEAPLVLNYAS